MSLISVSNLTFAYDGSYDNVFENVSFQIPIGNWGLQGETAGERQLFSIYCWATISTKVISQQVSALIISLSMSLTGNTTPLM
jgi:hypothetical protein